MKQIGRYQLTGKLGQGGMGVVYAAHDPILGRDVAIKLLPAHLLSNPAMRQRFMQEAKTIASLQHPNIVPILDYGEHSEDQLTFQPYFVMALMEGGSLGGRLGDGMPMPLPEVQRILSYLAPAFDAAHRQNIVHRDVKPDNILFDRNNIPYLADFGIARLVASGGTVTVTGTPAYMAPEQYTAKSGVDGRTDIYQLGITIYQMVTGRLPFDTNTPERAMYHHINVPPPPVRRLNANLPAQWETVLNTALAKEPTDRYASVGALADALRLPSAPTTIVYDEDRIEQRGSAIATTLPPTSSQGNRQTTSATISPIAKWGWVVAGVLALLVGFLGIRNAQLGSSRIESTSEPTEPTLAGIAKELTSTKSPPRTPRPTATQNRDELNPISSVSYDGPKRTVYWLVGLGTGSNNDQHAVQEAVVKAFNDANPDVELVLEIVNNAVAPDTLATYIAAGNAPDIVGPIGLAGSNRYVGNWLDMQPIIDDMGYDLGQFLPESVEFYRVNGELIGLPFAEFPTMVFYNRELFDDAGLAYPPQKFGERYADGDVWDFDKVREIGMLLTVDANGNNATSSRFNPDSVEQWGFVHQWAADIRAVGHNWGAADMFDSRGRAIIPDSYREGIQWTYDAIWRDNFHPNTAYQESDLLASPNAFGTGNVAMALTHQWFTCCLGDADFAWDLAVVPSVDGQYTSKLHADTFRMLDYGQSDSQKQAAFSALSYIVGEASDDLLRVYGGMPARPTETEAFFAGLDRTYPFNVNWQVSVDSLAYNDQPSHEGNMPNFAESSRVVANFWSLLQSKGDLDLYDVTEQLQDDLDASFTNKIAVDMDRNVVNADRLSTNNISGVTYQGTKKTVRWFVGLGTGNDEAQKRVQLQVVEAFNRANPDVTLDLEVVPNQVAGDTLSTYIAAGNAPDIVGPVSIAGSNRYVGNWLDMQPIIDGMGYDLDQFLPESVEFYRVDDELIGLPFAEFPAMVFYNRQLFDEAGLAYPPQKFGERDADGDVWDFDKVRELGMLLTIDDNGNDATSSRFNPNGVEQWGFIHQWATDIRAVGHNWGAAEFDSRGRAVIPASYREGIQWTYDAIWEDYFHPNTEQQRSDLLSTPNAFASGNVAMALTHQWFTCCLGDADFEWDLAVVPSVDGEYTSKMHSDTFRMLDYGQDDNQKQAAFSALSYIVGEASDDLLQVYSGMPARPSETQAFFAGLDQRYSFNVNWQVPLDSLVYNDRPSHEGNMPNFAESDQVSRNFWSLLQSDGELDLDGELDRFTDDLQEAFDR